MTEQELKDMRRKKYLAEHGLTETTAPKLTKRRPMFYEYQPRKGREYVRALVRRRDGFTCQDCGIVRTPEQSHETGKRQLDVHHLNGLCGKRSHTYDRVSEMSGLITLCHKCHFNRHDYSTRFDKVTIPSRNR
jgi:5-methylcytosine-specific restriction endonuclease McrA